MLIIKHPDTYQCSVCHTEYTTAAKAQFCESHRPLGECPVAIGQSVNVVTRYDGLELDTVIAQRIANSTGNIIEHARSLDKLQDIVPHEWRVQVTSEHQIGKDSSSDWLSDTCCLELDVAKEWNAFYHNRLLKETF